MDHLEMQQSAVVISDPEIVAREGDRDWIGVCRWPGVPMMWFDCGSIWVRVAVLLFV